MKQLGSSMFTAVFCLLTLTAFVKSDSILQTGSIEQIKIGNQIWMSKNLNVGKFRNGEIIPQAKTNEEWNKAGREGKPAWCYYDNNPLNEKKYGKLYNWYAVNDTRGLAPNGWHVSSDSEWSDLTDFLGGESYAGTKLKTINGWEDNYKGTNETGFAALPGGTRLFGPFEGVGVVGNWWTSKEFNTLNAWICYLSDEDVYTENENKHYGLSVRCVKN